MKTKTYSLLAMFGLFVSTTWASDPANHLVAKYTFDGRAGAGETFQRTHNNLSPFDGEDYIPSSACGELGPPLRNPGPGGAPAYYRSYINHAADASADGREVLELKRHHVSKLDTYHSPSGENTLPSEGSFSWEVIARIDEYDGTNHYGMLIDATKGAGRLVNYPGEGNNQAIVTRLWMRPFTESSYQLCFTVPRNEKNEGETVSTELQRGHWYHIAAVYDADFEESRLYVDGKLMDAKHAPSIGNRSTGFGLFGSFGPDVFRVDHPMRLQAGMIDAVAFSAEALPPSDFTLPRP